MAWQNAKSEFEGEAERMEVRVTDCIHVTGSDGYSYQLIEYTECARVKDIPHDESESEHGLKSFQLLTGQGVDCVGEGTWRVRGTKILPFSRISAS